MVMGHVVAKVYITVVALEPTLHHYYYITITSGNQNCGCFLPQGEVATWPQI